MPKLVNVWIKDLTSLIPSTLYRETLINASRLTRINDIPNVNGWEQQVHVNADEE